jgi:hypothetical protein
MRFAGVSPSRGHRERKKWRRKEISEKRNHANKIRTNMEEGGLNIRGSEIKWKVETCLNGRICKDMHTLRQISHRITFGISKQLIQPEMFFETTASIGEYQKEILNRIKKNAINFIVQHPEKYILSFM